MEVYLPSFKNYDSRRRTKQLINRKADMKVQREVQLPARAWDIINVATNCNLETPVGRKYPSIHFSQLTPGIRSKTLMFVYR